MIEVEYQSERPHTATIENVVADAGFGAVIQPVSEKGLIVKTKDLKENERQELLSVS